jgi:hypothetical protein
LTTPAPTARAGSSAAPTRSIINLGVDHLRTAARAGTPLNDQRAQGGHDGLSCPRCGCNEFRVSHTYRKKRFIRRRRVCLLRKRPLWTIEQSVADNAQQQQFKRAA